MKKAILVLVLALMAGAARAQAAAADKGEEQVTVITSEKLTFDYKKHYALFEVNVVVVDPEMKILADKMTVFFDDNNRTKTIKCEGDVYIIQDDKKAKSQVATYDVESGKIVLTGNPQITQEKNILTGDVVTFFRDDNRLLVEPRAKLVFFPNGTSRDSFFGEGKSGK